jgi:hypothetical protein
MSYLERIFKKEIPDEIINKFVNILGLCNIYDNKWIPTSSFTPEICKKLDDLIVDIVPYYQEHKTYIVTRDMNTRRYIQILRHLVKSKKLQLESKSYGATKGTYYRILSDLKTDTEWTISFD